MENIKEYDLFILDLKQRINVYPDKKWRIILQALKGTECPYLKKKIKNIYFKNNIY